jgi:hypothetical protein
MAFQELENGLGMALCVGYDEAAFWRYLSANE